MRNNNILTFRPSPLQSHLYIHIYNYIIYVFLTGMFLIYLKKNTVLHEGPAVRLTVCGYMSLLSQECSRFVAADMNMLLCCCVVVLFLCFCIEMPLIALWDKVLSFYFIASSFFRHLNIVFCFHQFFLLKSYI